MKKLVSLALVLMLSLCLIAQGEIVGNTYINTGIGFTVTAPEGWSFVDGDADMPGNEEGASCTLVTLQDADAINNMLVMATNMGSLSAFITEDMLLSATEEQVDSQYAEYGFTVNSKHETFVVLGGEHDSVVLTMSLYGIDMVQRYVIVKVDNIMVEIVATGSSVEEVDYMISCVTKL
ncbi:MAG: hypothetical protein II920_07965 [Clostridia bacterium]|nr:hypothetical protein [Clostridia bacterium]